MAITVDLVFHRVSIEGVRGTDTFHNHQEDNDDEQQQPQRSRT
jgi:hypothetical protein